MAADTPERDPSPTLEPYSAIVPEREDGAWQWALLVLAGGIAYASSFGGIFTFGDEGNIVSNATIRHLFPIADHLATKRPLVSLSFAFNYTISELDVIGYHAFNLLVHLIAAITLFGVVRRTLLRPQFNDRYKDTADWLALAVSLLWTVHPLLTESVTYISQRSESMMGMFYLLSLYFVIRSAASCRPLGWYLLAIIACAMGMASKAVMLTAPLVILLYDRAFLAESFTRAFRWRWPLYAGLAATWYILFHLGVVQAAFAADAIGFGFGLQQPTPWQYVTTQPDVILHYLRLSLWPDPLCIDYGWAIADGAVRIAVPGAAVLILVALTIWGSIRKPAIGFLGIWFFVILAPTSSILPIHDMAVEHRMYLPLAAVVAIAVLLAYSFIERSGLSRPNQITIMVVVVLAAATALGFRTFERNKVYHSGVALWADALKSNPMSARPHSYLAYYYKTSERNMGKAVEQWATVLEKDPDNIDALLNLGIYYGERGDTNKAIDYYQRILSISPDHADAYYNIGVLFQDVGRHEEAVEAFRTAQRSRPRNLDIYFLAANSLDALGRTDEAIRELRKGIKAVGPDFEPAQLAAVHFGLGNAYIRKNELELAISEFRMAVMHSPKHSAAYHALGWALAKQGRFAEAELALTKASAHQPESDDIKRTLRVVRDRLAGITTTAPAATQPSEPPSTQPVTD